MSENDAEFIEIMMQDGDWQPGSRMHRLALLARRGAAITPRPIESVPKDREVIGVERPPFEDRNYFHMGQWNEEHQQFMADAGYDMDTGARRWAFCGVTHYIDPEAVPILPEHVFEDGNDE